jgi:hypothetical protein
MTCRHRPGDPNCSSSPEGARREADLQVSSSLQQARTPANRDPWRSNLPGLSAGGPCPEILVSIQEDFRRQLESTQRSFLLRVDDSSEQFKRQVDAACRVLLIAGLDMSPELGESYAATSGELSCWLRTVNPELARQIDEARDLVLRSYYATRLSELFGGRHDDEQA